VSLALLYTYDVFHQIVSRYMAEFGLSKSTFNILMLLRSAPDEGMQLHDLGELLLVSRANITGLIDHLEEKGYVIRVVDTNDRRARYARITDKGEALLDEFVPLHHGNIRMLMGDLTTTEKETLVILLKKTRSNLMVHSEECAAKVCGVAHG
jgi:MarR family 2-MHQ and catechol resistance regulon transcriptional repressor